MAADNPRVASFEEGFHRKSRTHARILVNQLAILVKVGMMHDLKNVAVENAAEALMGTLGLFLEERKSFSLTLIGDYFFIEDDRIKYNMEDFNNFDFLVGEFKKRGLGALSFNSSASAPEMVVFVSAFLGADTSSGEAYQDLLRRLGGAGISGIGTEEVRAAKVEVGFEKVVDTVKAARNAYVRVVVAIKRMFEGVGLGQPADIRKLKRAVQSLVESAYNNENELIRLSAIRRGEDVMPRHYTNVAVLSLGIGKRLGLSKYQMGRLGMAAVLHDLGRHGLPADIMEKAEDPGSPAWDLIRNHPRQGVQTILRLKGLNEVAVSAMIVAYEHHRNIDGSGYPEAIEHKEMGLFSRVVRIADNYDATTSSGIYGRIPVPPRKALELMVGRAGRYYDKDLMRLFTAMMGAYPVGSLLLLSDGRVGVVRAPGPEAADRPLVRLLELQAPVAEQGWEVVDLSGKDSSGNYKVDVAGALDPYQCGVDIYRYMFD